MPTKVLECLSCQLRRRPCTAGVRLREDDISVASVVLELWQRTPVLARQTSAAEIGFFQILNFSPMWPNMMLFYVPGACIFFILHAKQASVHDSCNIRRSYCLRSVRYVAPQWFCLLFRTICRRGMQSTSYSLG